MNELAIQNQIRRLLPNIKAHEIVVTINDEHELLRDLRGTMVNYGTKREVHIDISLDITELEKLLPILDNGLYVTINEQRIKIYYVIEPMTLSYSMDMIIGIRLYFFVDL